MQEARNERRAGETITVRFDEDPARVQALAAWSEKWNVWSVAERPARAAMKAFEHFYELKGRIDRESERVELLLGDGRLRWVSPNGPTDFPILLQRVELEFDASVPEFHVLDADRAPEVYSSLIQESEELQPATLNELRQEVERLGLHPLAGGETSAWLRRVVQLLGAHGQFREERSNNTPSQDPLIERWPVLLLRQRSGGYAAAFDRVLQTLESDPDLPAAMERLVGVELPEPADSDDAPVATDSADFTRVWSEPPDVLLSKPANQEQIQIARAIEQHRAVLVQGPPGTGKSHTIANLIGHLVAQGKRVLVTSHTTKALRVLRGHVVENIRALCVSLLDNDLAARVELEGAVRQILSRLSQSTESSLARDAEALAKERSDLNSEIDRITTLLRDAREAEYREIVLSGETVAPSRAAIWVREHAEGNDWIPGQLGPGAPLPLSHDELLDLYGTNARITREEEEELSAPLPDFQRLPAAAEFERMLHASIATADPDFAPFWTREATEAELPRLVDLHTCVSGTVTDLKSFVQWQVAIVRAGHGAGVEARQWSELEAKVSALFTRWETAYPQLQEHGPVIGKGLDMEAAKRLAEAIVSHLEAGGSLGKWALLLHKEWKALLECARVNGRPPSTPAHFRAVRALAALQLERDSFRARWQRLAEPAGLPAFDTLPDPPEPALRDYAAQFARLLDWWSERWRAVEKALDAAGFRWAAFREREVARGLPAAPFDRDCSILAGALTSATENQHATALAAQARRQISELDAYLVPFSGALCRALHAAVRAWNLKAYEAGMDDLLRLIGLSEVLKKRRALLNTLKAAAPEWSRAISTRIGVHGQPAIPGDDIPAWRWRQLQQELTRRAALDEVELTRTLERRREELRDTTAQLVDRRAWLSQLRRTGLEARQALQGWADTVRKIGKGTGKRAPALQAQARRLLSQARDAVPVWIMPLARVAESFDPASKRFDVVIVDEASQSDVTGLLAWYLADRVVIVGDHEQVSPSAIGDKVEDDTALIAQHLQGVPNSHLYDGRTSIYDLARQCFGGTIALREHFRCVPAIIEFSNGLSYQDSILPLRDPGSVPRPHVVEFTMTRGMGSKREGKANEGEARVVVALAQALIARPELADKTMGAITLLGDEQASLIQQLIVPLIGSAEMERRRFVAGNSAQFQGDERDIMFLSMVDTPTGAPLRLVEADAMKQRYNVAASRAKDHMWLIHSLDPNLDLKPGDLRRRLIEHVRDPEGRLRELQKKEARAESEFEKEVIRRLVNSGYRVEPQVWVGQYRIDMVVSCGEKQVALECDGDRFHPPEKIPEDMARQAVLERTGWRFVRIRGTRFYRSPEKTMAWVYSELSELGVEPSGFGDGASHRHVDGADFRTDVTARVHEIMREQGWLVPIDDDQHPLELFPEPT
ncbi:MAG TPA: AAA domain-containing protein [Gemmatimonadaceae bacterium]|nr:AAA domain-containing protein [Gemmatimonadaceae bacterium]